MGHARYRLPPAPRLIGPFAIGRQLGCAFERDVRNVDPLVDGPYAVAVLGLGFASANQSRICVLYAISPPCRAVCRCEAPLISPRPLPPSAVLPGGLGAVVRMAEPTQVAWVVASAMAARNNVIHVGAWLGASALEGAHR